ncbi:MAG: DNA-directed RNA polymerase subunit K [Euryarchaeota archaeon]|nr:DNA-directed RNA polymerase subunit K [Euryarchaeota archaeon]
MMPPSEKYTRFEKAKIIGARSLQIAMGAPSLLDLTGKDPLEITMAEFEADVIPITVKRRK